MCYIERKEGRKTETKEEKVRKWAARDHRWVWVKGIWEFWEFYELFLQLLVS